MVCNFFGHLGCNTAASSAGSVFDKTVLKIEYHTDQDLDLIVRLHHGNPVDLWAYRTLSTSRFHPVARCTSTRT